MEQLPNLGLVCMTISRDLRFRTMTRKRLLQLSPQEQVRALLDIYRDNAATLGRAPDYCRSLGVRLYRVPSGIFPFADEPVGIEVLQRIDAVLAETGEACKRLGVRLVMHPDQFVVLNSESEAVVANSVKLLIMHARILDALGQPQSAWATVEIHGGKGGRPLQLVEAIARLPTSVRTRLALENDEKTYGAREILDVCRAAGVPMVFDAHHHVCHERLDSFEHPSVTETFLAARTTWPNPNWQMVHISNGREHFNDFRHSDEIATMPSIYARAPWIEIEAKHKELAIRRLQREWLARLPPSSAPKPVAGGGSEAPARAPRFTR